MLALAACLRVYRGRQIDSGIYIIQICPYPFSNPSKQLHCTVVHVRHFRGKASSFIICIFMLCVVARSHQLHHVSSSFFFFSFPHGVASAVHTDVHSRIEEFFPDP